MVIKQTGGIFINSGLQAIYLPITSMSMEVSS